MSKSAFRSLKRRLNGQSDNKPNPRKHPVLSGSVPVVTYTPPSWRYGSNHN